MSDDTTDGTPESPYVSSDVNALVQMALRDAYRQSTEDLRLVTDKLRSLNEQKQAIRDYITPLREFRAEAIRGARKAQIDLCATDKRTDAALARLFDELAHDREQPDEETALIGYALCIPERIPPAGTLNFTDLDSAIAGFEEKLRTIGDDAELTTLELQTALQKKQQAIELLSNISRSEHDTALAIIRNLKV